MALGRHGEAAEHLAKGFDEAQRNNYTDVLAEGIVNAARLVSVASPGGRDRALGWMRALAALPEASARVRDDAKAMVNALSGGVGAASEPAVALEHLVRECRGAVAALLQAERITS